MRRGRVEATRQDEREVRTCTRLRFFCADPEDHEGTSKLFGTRFIESLRPRVALLTRHAAACMPKRSRGVSDMRVTREPFSAGEIRRGVSDSSRVATGFRQAPGRQHAFRLRPLGRSVPDGRSRWRVLYRCILHVPVFNVEPRLLRGRRARASSPVRLFSLWLALLLRVRLSRFFLPCTGCVPCGCSPPH